jgi:hypothetical protein
MGNDSFLQNGNQKRQRESAIETATRSGKKQGIGDYLGVL